jgi:N-acylneuraminate cytidylyltransferase
MQKADLFDEIWVSTDCNEIGEVAMQYGAKFHKRSAYAARDQSSSAESYVELINKHPDVWAVAGFQCTVPTQDPGLMTKAYNMLVTDEYDCVFTVSRSFKFRWSEIVTPGQVTAPLNFDPAKRPRRQDWNGELVESGAFYFFKREVMEKTGHYQAGRVGYLEDPNEDYIDIDTPQDFRRCEIMVTTWAEKLGLGTVTKK